jgi:hypothetical protein
MSRSLAGGDGLNTIEVAGTGVFCTVQRVCEYIIVTCESVHIFTIASERSTADPGIGENLDMGTGVLSALGLLRGRSETPRKEC